MTRRLKNGVLEAFCKYSEETEVPSTFAIWTGIATVSAALGRDCCVDYGFFTVYPNLYIVLVAGSAKCRKSTAVGMASGFIGKIEPSIHLLSQKMTPEALIGSLSGTNVKDEQTVVMQAEGILIADEISTFLDRNAFKSGLIALLTKLYDCTDFTYETKSRGVESVINPCLSIFGGSTIDWIKTSIPPEAIGGGFTSRVVFVYKDKKARSIPWPIRSAENVKRGEDIVHDLCEIRRMRGIFALSDEARAMFDNEYGQFNDRSPLFESKNMSGYANRRHITLLKVAMVISASRRDDRLIDARDMGTAINAMRMVERDMVKVLAAISQEFIGDMCDEVINFLKLRKQTSRSELVRAMRNKLSSQQLDVVIRTLEETKGIKADYDERKGTMTYYYTPERYERQDR